MDVKNGNEFLRKVIKLILDEESIVGNATFIKRNYKKILDFKYPKELESSWDLTIKKEGESESDLLDFCRQVICQSIKTSHPNFYNQLYGGVEEYGLAGAFMTDALNTSAATWEISPVFAVIEKSLIQYLGKLIAYKDGSIDGMFCPGGSMANMYGMVLARHHAFPQSKQKGIQDCGQLVMFASEESHYSFVKSSIWLGSGTQSVIKVKTDESGRMCPQELEKCISEALTEGKVPYLVGATSGTTVLGAFDSLPEIADICKKFNLWLHVDAALGGSWIFSSKHKHLLNGIERADSVTWDLHKMACIPFQCSLILTKHPNILTEANSLKAEYLFQCDKYYDSSYDSGDKSIQCGRKVDSLKLWLALKAYGENGMEKIVNNVYDMAQYLTQKLRTRPGFQLVLPQFESNNICFWYTPPDMRNGKPLSKEMLSKIAPEIKKRMMESGSLMIGYQPLSTKGLPNFFRLNISCFPQLTEEDMDFVITEIERLGQDIKLC